MAGNHHLLPRQFIPTPAFARGTGSMQKKRNIRTTYGKRWRLSTLMQ